MRFPTATLAILLSLCILPSIRAEDQKPNLVLIFIDDMGYGDIGPFGSKLNRTPNLDRMASEGMKLTSFYAAPVCSASRAQLMTGSYAPRVSVPGVFFPAGKNGLNPEEHTVADYLRESGYATMCIGKWHLGDQREFLPTNNGFDGYYGIPYSNDMARKSSADGRNVHPLMRDTEVAELLVDEGQRRITKLYTEEAIEFIEVKAGEKKPFFLYMPHTAMHVPLFPHKNFAGNSGNGTYGDWVEEVDWSVGQVLAAIERAGIDENTLVVFTSDNGPWASKGKAGGVSGPLRGSKGCTLEGGVREPTIARWKGKIAPGKTSDAIAGTTDILPTFVSLAGGKLREEVKIDGVDISPVLFGNEGDPPRDTWYYFQGNGLKAVRSGPWKLALKAQGIGMGMRDKPADLQKGGRLYNLDEEIGEVTDVAADNPEIVKRLEALATAMEADVSANRRPAGTVENPVTLYPTEARGKRPKNKNSNKPTARTEPINWKDLEIGDSFPSSSAPQVGGKPFGITCTIDGENPSGVIVAHGGSSVGYSLYANTDNQLVFAVRVAPGKIGRVTQPITGTGAIDINASLRADGTLSLSQNGGTPATAKSGGPISKQPQEELCIGYDSSNPVDTESPRQRFSGKVVTLSVALE